MNRLAEAPADLSFRAEPESLFIVLSGPGGTGKTTLIKRWLDTDSDLHYVPNVTTRKPRDAASIDETGLYQFVTHAQFQAMVRNDAFAQWVNPSKGKYYGTPLAPLLEAINRRHDLVFDYTPQLFINLRRQFRARVVGIFVIPPTLHDLAERLRTRGTEQGGELEIKYRMGLQDLAYIDEHDYYVVNDRLDDTLAVLKSIKAAEKHKLERLAGITERCKVVSPRPMLFYYDPLETRVQSISS